MDQLQAALGRYESALEQLSLQLQAYRGLSPEAAAALQASHDTLAAEKQAAQEAAAAAEERAAAAALQTSALEQAQEEARSELQGRNDELAAALQHKQVEAERLLQEKEITRAQAALLQARLAAALDARGPAAPLAPPPCSMADVVAQIDRWKGMARKYKVGLRGCRVCQRRVT
jgi:plasmid maintenance system antidote protein VapI